MITLNEPVGLVRCCGVTPVYTTPGGPQGFRCQVCHRSAFGWGGSTAWHAGLWNKQFHKTHWDKHGEHWSEKTLVHHEAPLLDLPAWKFAELEYSYHPPYSARRTTACDFCLFQVPGRSDESLLVSKEGWTCIINESRCVNPIMLRSLEGCEFNLTIPEFKSSCPVSIHVGRSWCTDSTWWYRVYITTHNYKWHRKMAESLAGILTVVRLP
jgi:hypothetical protein